MQVFYPILAHFKRSKVKMEVSLMLHEIYVRHPKLSIEWLRRLVDQVIRHRPGLIKRATRFRYCGLGASVESIRLVNHREGRMRLSVRVPQVEVTATFGLLAKIKLRADFRIDAGDCAGDRRDLIEYCLLRWRQVPEEIGGQVWS